MQTNPEMPTKNKKLMTRIRIVTWWLRRQIAFALGAFRLQSLKVTTKSIYHELDQSLKPATNKTYPWSSCLSWSWPSKSHQCLWWHSRSPEYFGYLTTFVSCRHSCARRRIDFHKYSAWSSRICWSSPNFSRSEAASSMSWHSVKMIKLKKIHQITLQISRCCWLMMMRMNCWLNVIHVSLLCAQSTSDDDWL